MKHHTKDKGDIGVLKCQADLGERGYKIFVSISEHLPFDFVAYKNKKFYRIQAKYISAINNEYIPLDLRSCWSDLNGAHRADLDKSEVDLVAIYCPDTEKCYYLVPDIMHMQRNLRLIKPKNNQKKFINMADDFLTPA